MTIQCGYFHDVENRGWNGYVLDRPEINATSGESSPSNPGSFEKLQDMIVDGWNAATPGEQITVDDLEWVEVDPYKSVYGDAPDDVFVVDMAAVRQLPTAGEQIAAMREKPE